MVNVICKCDCAWDACFSRGWGESLCSPSARNLAFPSQLFVFLLAPAPGFELSGWLLAFQNLIPIDKLGWFWPDSLKYSMIYTCADHRIIEWFGLEGTFKGHLVQSHCKQQGHLQLGQVAQSPIQPDFECFQGWGIYHLSGQPVLVLHHPQNKEFLPYI